MTHKLRTPDSSVILAHLADEDFDQFHAAHIGYSGSTGKGGSAGGAEHAGPYIATFWSEFTRAIDAMRWTHISLTRQGESWMARKAAASQDDRVRAALSECGLRGPEIDADLAKGVRCLIETLYEREGELSTLRVLVNSSLDVYHRRMVIKRAEAAEAAAASTRALCQELVDRYTKREPVMQYHGGCGWCGGLPHSTECLVGRMEAVLRTEHGRAA